MSKKTMGTLIYLNRIKDKFDNDSRILVVQALVLSIINYCSRIWGSTNKSQIQRVQKLHNFAATIACGNVRKYDHAIPFIDKLNWLKIENKCLFDTCVLFYKILNNQIPSWLLNLTPVGEVNQRITRQLNDLFIPRTNTLTGGRNMAIRGSSLWNGLPGDLKEICSTQGFKSRLKKHFLELQ